MEVTVGMGSGFATRPGAHALLQRLVDMGCTSVETYVRWIDVAPDPDHWDWSIFDADVEALTACGLRWVPFLIAGPWYATPNWFKEGPHDLRARCLEHDRATGAQSIWNPHLFPEIQRLIAAFANHYRTADVVESLLLGVTGDYGEAIYTVVGNWPGDYHGHPGYWCGDHEARAAFRRWLEERYRTVESLGAVWNTPPPAAWASVQPPASPQQASSPIAWLDFVTWYREAMTTWSAQWLMEARRQLPSTEIYLCTGGDMVPTHGSDFSEQCRIAASANAGVRITNEGSDYVQNLLLTRIVSTAGRHYGAYYGFEPAAAVDAVGVSARQFNAIGSGAQQLHEYQSNIIHNHQGQIEPIPGSTEAWERGQPQLVQRRPQFQAGLLLSLPDLALREAGILGDALPLARPLRQLCDFEVLDDHLMTQGAARSLRAIVLTPARFWDGRTFHALRDFAEHGGLVIAAGVRPSVLAGSDATEALFGFTPDTESLFGISAVRVVEGAPLPSYARVPALHMTQSYRDLDPAIVPLLALTHTPSRGGQPLVAWYRRWGRGATVFFAGRLSQGEGWMSVPGATQALLTDFLTALPTALGMTPVTIMQTRGVYETPTDCGTLAWNASGADTAWNGQTLVAGGITWVSATSQ